MLAAVTWTILLPVPGVAQEQPRVPDTAPTSAEDVVRRLYDLVTFDAGTTPDWDQVRSLFLDEAVIVLRTARDSTTVFSLEGFVADFVSFIERANVEQTGFAERIVALERLVLKDMAHVAVLYEASIPGRDRPPQQGVDLFLLTRQAGRWRIAAITNDIPDSQHPVPHMLQVP
jgi:hypothetical protein